MKNMKKWIFIWLLSISSLLFVVLFNYIIDPYQQYRKGTLYRLPFEHEKELNAGLAKNFDFDMVVLGTSMMQNFNIDDMKNILNYEKPIKLTIAGSSVYEQNIILSTAFRHQKIKNVLVGIDFFSYYGDVHRFKHGGASFPTYLYDENLLNDYKYLASSDTLGRSFELLFKNSSDEWIYDYTKMYEWKSRTNDENILSAIKNKWENRKYFDDEAKEEEKKLHYLIDNFDLNLKPFFQKHKNTNFVLFFPPYSILAYKAFEERGELKDFLEFKKHIIKSVVNQTNVKIYDFQLAEDITYNLYNYYDLYHYNKEISKWILTQIATNNYLIKSENEYQMNIFLSDIVNYKVSDDSFVEVKK